MKLLTRGIKDGIVSSVIVYKLDRLSRSLDDLLPFVKLCKKHSVALVSASESIDTATPAGEAMLQMIGVFAQFERGTIRARIADVATARRKARRVYCGITPFGYTRVADALMVNPEEQAAMNMVRTMLASGTSLRKCGAWLDDHGFKPRRAARWSAQSLKDMLCSKMATAA